MDRSECNGAAFASPRSREIFGRFSEARATAVWHSASSLCGCAVAAEPRVSIGLHAVASTPKSNHTGWKRCATPPLDSQTPVTQAGITVASLHLAVFWRFLTICLAKRRFFATDKALSGTDKGICATPKPFSMQKRPLSGTPKVMSRPDKLLDVAKTVLSGTEKVLSVGATPFRAEEKIFLVAARHFGVAEKVFAVTEKVSSRPNRVCGN
jgi:hypothetical protein